MSEPATTVGVRCPACGHGRAPRLFTRQTEGATVRVRKCAACGHRFRTREHIIQATAPTRPRSTS